MVMGCRHFPNIYKIDWSVACLEDGRVVGDYRSGKEDCVTMSTGGGHSCPNRAHLVPDQGVAKAHKPRKEYVLYLRKNIRYCKSAYAFVGLQCLKYDQLLNIPELASFSWYSIQLLVAEQSLSKYWEGS